MSNEIAFQTINTVFCDLEILRKKVIEKRFEIKDRYNFDIQKDCRIRIYEQLVNILLYHNINLKFFLRHLLDEKDAPKVMEIVLPTDLRIMQTHYLTSNRFSLFISYQSVFEAYYRYLCNAMGVKCPNTFTDLTKNLFTHLGIDENSDWSIANYIFGRIRNTIHNNGVHTQNTETINYKDISHCFEKGVPQDSASYDFFKLLLSDTIAYLDYIAFRTQDIPLIEHRTELDFPSPF